MVTPFYPDADDTVFPFEVVRYPSLDITKAVGYRAGLPFDADVLARLEGVLLDPVYTGKAFAGLIGLIRRGAFKAGETVLFVHTGGSPALYAYQPVLQTP